MYIFQGGRSKEHHSGNIVVREDPPGPSGSQEGEVEEEEGLVVERVESGTASHRDSAAGDQHLHGIRSCHVYPPSFVKVPESCSELKPYAAKSYSSLSLIFHFQFRLQ